MLCVAGSNPVALKMGRTIGVTGVLTNSCSDVTVTSQLRDDVIGVIYFIYYFTRCNLNYIDS